MRRTTRAHLLIAGCQGGDAWTPIAHSCHPQMTQPPPAWLGDLDPWESIWACLSKCLPLLFWGVAMRRPDKQGASRVELQLQKSFDNTLRGTKYIFLIYVWATELLCTMSIYTDIILWLWYNLAILCATYTRNNILCEHKSRLLAKSSQDISPIKKIKPLIWLWNNFWLFVWAFIYIFHPNVLSMDKGHFVLEANKGWIEYKKVHSSGSWNTSPSTRAI